MSAAAPAGAAPATRTGAAPATLAGAAPVTLAGWGAAALALGVTAAYATWLLGHPASLPSDDALFFARGALRWSVLEFSPHFPGYPAFALGARALALLSGDAARAVFLLSALAGLAIPLAVGCWIRAGGAPLGFALAGAACALAQPGLPGLSLAMLSDSLGLALWLWHGVALRCGYGAASGVLLGLCVAARPTYALLAWLPALALARLRREQLARFAAGFAAVGALCAAFVLSADGLAYFSEGARFVSGHFGIWGRGQHAAAPPSWWASLRELGGGAAGLALAAAALVWATPRLRRREPAELCALAALPLYALWIALAQNPENPRHAAPLFFLATPLIALGLARRTPRAPAAALLALLLAHALWSSASALERSQRPAPLAQASRALADWPGALLITQRGIEVLRAEHPGLAILDAHYAASANFALRSASAERPVLRLSGAPLAPPWQRVERFPARFPGELPLELYFWPPAAGAAGGWPTAAR